MRRKCWYDAPRLLSFPVTRLEMETTRDISETCTYILRRLVEVLPVRVKLARGAIVLLHPFCAYDLPVSRVSVPFWTYAGALTCMGPGPI